MRMAHGPHAARHAALQRAFVERCIGAHGLPKRFEFADRQLGQYIDEARSARGSVKRVQHASYAACSAAGSAVGAEDKIDRAMLPMPARRVDTGAGWIHRVVVGQVLAALVG